LKIAVLCGGTSSEREVSLNSGAAVAEGLKEAGYETVTVDVKSVRELLDGWPGLGADGAFIALHGGWGEDGRLQSALGAAGIPYTGSRPRACMRCMDKEAARDAMENAGVPVPPGFAVTPDARIDFAELIGKWKTIVVKPASNGSTVGVAITDSATEAVRALNAVWDVDTKAVVEKFIPGRELTVTVFGSGGDAFALPAIDIRPASGFYDYKSKYTKGATEYLCPAPLDDETAARLAGYARKSHEALECRTYSRVDFRLTGEGGLFALEINTAPGMTATSLVPKAALAAGWTFPQLLDKVVRDSFAV
jgi:D-alanine-D-alanine ligase